MAPTTAQSASAKRAKRANPYVKEESGEEGHSGASANEELKKLMKETQEESLKQIGEVLKAVGEKSEASNQVQLKRLEEVLKAVSEKSEASNLDLSKRMEEAIKAAGDKSEASNRDHLKRVEELIQASEDRIKKLPSNQETFASLVRIEDTLNGNDERMKKLESAVGEIAQIPRVVPAKQKSITQQGMMQFLFNVNDLQMAPNKCLTSNGVSVMSAKWYIVVENVLQSGDYLGIYLHCVPLEEGKSYSTNITLQLLGSKDTVTKTGYCHFKKGDKHPGWGLPHFIDWTTFAARANRFVDKRGNAEVRVNFTFELHHDRGGRPFFDSASFNSDCVLLVQNQRVHVNKGFLSVHSPYFAKLFNSDFREKNQDEITIGDNIAAIDFAQLLEAIYPSLKHEITAKNVECLLRMADRFQMEIVTQRCEVFLRSCSTGMISLEKKLVLAQEYHLKEFFESCVAEYKTWDDVKKLKKTGEYVLLTPDTKAFMFDSI